MTKKSQISGTDEFSSNWLYDFQISKQLGSSPEVILSRWSFYVREMSGHLWRPDLRILDAGSGDGLNQILISAFCSDRRTSLASDISTLRIGRVKARFPEANVVVSSIEQLCLTNESFDLVLCNHVLEHLDDPRVAMREFARLLKPNGLLLIGIPNEGCFLAQLRNNLLQRQIKATTDHRFFFTSRKFRRIAKECGFKMEGSARFGFFFPHSTIRSVVTSRRFGRLVESILGKLLPSQSTDLQFSLRLD